MEKIELKTRDGICPSYLFRPSTAGPWPAVLVYMDGMGIRPAMLEIGEGLAANGYFALLPDLFYRSGPYAAVDPRALTADPEARQRHRDKFMALATLEDVMSDSQSFFDYLASAQDLRPGVVGTVGYCMGGRMSLASAGTFPDRMLATASFHGGGLASNAPDSPHRLAPKMKAQIYVAGATEDPSFPDDMKQRLEQALTEAGVRHTIETYPAKHGWVFRDTAAYDPAASERHWHSMLAFFAQAFNSH